MPKTAVSRRYLTLASELQALREQLLPRRFDPTGTYPTRVFTRAASYRVLVHAEIESYFEDRVWELALSSVQTLKAGGKVSRVIACLLGFSNQKMDQPPESITPAKGISRDIWNQKLDLLARIDTALTVFKACIEENHGIRERNLLRLLLPVGIETHQLDAAWLSTMDSFGERRGTVAHRSAASYRATQLPDPKDELATVKNLLKGIKEVDQYLNSLMP